MPLPEPLSTSGHACPASPQCLASEHEPTLVEEARRRVLQSGVTFSERLWRGVWDFVSGQVTIVYNCVTFYIPDLHGCFYAFTVFIHEFHHNLDSVPAKGTIWIKSLIILNCNNLWVINKSQVIYCFVCPSAVEFSNLIGQKASNNFLQQQRRWYVSVQFQ